MVSLIPLYPVRIMLWYIVLCLLMYVCKPTSRLSGPAQQRVLQVRTEGAPAAQAVVEALKKHGALVVVNIFAPPKQFTYKVWARRE